MNDRVLRWPQRRSSRGIVIFIALTAASSFAWLGVTTYARISRQESIIDELTKSNRDLMEGAADLYARHVLLQGERPDCDELRTESHLLYDRVADTENALKICGQSMNDLKFGALLDPQCKRKSGRKKVDIIATFNEIDELCAQRDKMGWSYID